MSRLTLTKRKLHRLIKEIHKYELEFPAYFFKLSDYELIKIYNGAGADSTWQAVRWLLTGLLSPLTTSILIHDVEFTFKVSPFKEVNDRFDRNNQKLIDGEYSWWNTFAKNHYGFLKIVAHNAVTNLGQNWEIIE